MHTHSTHCTHTHTHTHTSTHTLHTPHTHTPPHTAHTAHTHTPPHTAHTEHTHIAYSKLRVCNIRYNKALNSRNINTMRTSHVVQDIVT